MQRIPEAAMATTAAAVVGPSLDELAREGARRMLEAALLFGSLLSMGLWGGKPLRALIRRGKR